MNSYEGNFIAVEGIDGCGTTTLCENLQGELNGGYIWTKEPSEGIYGQFVRERLNDDEATPADFFAFLADRYEHCANVIEPALENGTNVITDRYDLSTYAYQSRMLDEELGIIDPFNYIDEMSYHFSVEPDIYFYIQISVDEAIARMNNMNDKYETRERLEEAKRVYDYLSNEKDNIHRIPGKWSKNDITREALRKIQAMNHEG